MLSSPLFLFLFLFFVCVFRVLAPAVISSISTSDSTSFLPLGARGVSDRLGLRLPRHEITPETPCGVIEDAAERFNTKTDEQKKHGDKTRVLGGKLNLLQVSPGILKEIDQKLICWSLFFKENKSLGCSSLHARGPVKLGGDSVWMFYDQRVIHDQFMLCLFF